MRTVKTSPLKDLVIYIVGEVGMVVSGLDVAYVDSPKASSNDVSLRSRICIPVGEVGIHELHALGTGVQTATTSSSNAQQIPVIARELCHASNPGRSCRAMGGHQRFGQASFHKKDLGIPQWVDYTS